MTTSSNTDGFRVLSVLLAVGVLMLVLGAEPAGAAFPGVNGKIAFYSDRNDPDPSDGTGVCEIFVMDPDGSNLTNLTNDTSSCKDVNPVFSPDRSKITFISFDSADDESEIYVMNADGSNRIRLTNNDVNDLYPAFSRDGKKIAFTSTMESTDAEIYVMDASDTDGDGMGDNLIRLTRNGAEDLFHVFSPRENKIAFESDRDGNYDLYLIDAVSDRNPIRLTDDALLEEVPNFSPDGRKITYGANDDSGVGAGDSDIYVVNADGSGTPTNLTNTPTTFEAAPAFSPDGKKIVYGAFDNAVAGIESDIYVMNSNGSGTHTNLTNNPAGDWWPNWGPDKPSSVIGTNPPS